MAYKTCDAVKRNLQSKFEEVCNGYLLELCNMWDLSAKPYGDWICNEVGGTWCYGENLFIDFDNIKYCVENNVSYSTYMDWLDYCTLCQSCNQSFTRVGRCLVILFFELDWNFGYVGTWETIP